MTIFQIYCFRYINILSNPFYILPFLNVTTRKFKITDVAHVIFPLDFYWALLLQDLVLNYNFSTVNQFFSLFFPLLSLLSDSLIHCPALELQCLVGIEFQNSNSVLKLNCCIVFNSWLHLQTGYFCCCSSSRRIQE